MNPDPRTERNQTIIAGVSLGLVILLGWWADRDFKKRLAKDRENYTTKPSTAPRTPTGEDIGSYRFGETIRGNQQAW